LLNLQEIGTASKNSIVLREYLQTKDVIDQTEKMIDKQDTQKYAIQEKI
jgi:hypothetical protein